MTNILHNEPSNIILSEGVGLHVINPRLVSGASRMEAAQGQIQFIHGRGTMLSILRKARLKDKEMRILML